MILTLTVSLLGGAGAATRYLIDGAAHRRLGDRFPWGTLSINVGGSFVLGLLTALLWHHGLPPRWHTALGIGFCGGLTTWSTASWESVRLAEEGRLGAAAGYTLGGMALALAAATAGLAAGTL